MQRTRRREHREPGEEQRFRGKRGEPVMIVLRMTGSLDGDYREQIVGCRV